MFNNLEQYPLLNWEPTEKQREAITALTVKTRFMLADVTGLGKTYSVLAAYAVLKQTLPELHLMVFGTVSSSVSWKKDIKKGTNFSHVEFGSKNPEYDELKSSLHDISIITYSALFKFQNFIVNTFNSRPIIMVLDEAHKVKNPEVKMRGVFERLTPHCAYMWMLTATPVTNHLVDLYWMIELLVPGYLGDHKDFLEMYTIRKDRFFRLVPGQRRGRCTVVYMRGAPFRKVREIVGYKNLEILSQKLEPILLRRDHELDIEFIPVQVQLTDHEEHGYLIAAAGLLGGTYKQFSARLPDLQLIVNNAVLMDREPNEDPIFISTKEKTLLDAVGIFLKDEPLLVFTSSRVTKKRLVALFRHYLRGSYTNIWEIDGTSSRKHRDKVTQKFGGRDILVITQAGGESLNLQAAGRILFYDLPFDLKVFVQAVGRVARMDTEYSKIRVYLYEAVGTIDSYKSLAIMSNAEVFKAVLKGASTLPSTLKTATKAQLKAHRKELLWRTKQLRGLRA